MTDGQRHPIANTFSVIHLKNAQRIMKGIRHNDEPMKVIPFNILWR